MQRIKQAESEISLKPQRNLAIDRLRGVLVMTMVTGDYIAGINWIPNTLKHAPDIGFTIADIVAPVFVFVMGLNFGSSFSRRAAENQPAAYRYFVTRFLSLLGLGAILTGGATLVNQSTGWGVLESLGIAGLITLAVIKLPTWLRVTIGFALLGFYQYFLDASMLQNVLHSGHGGFFGSLSWSALLILSTAVADILRKGVAWQVVGAAVISVLAAVAAVAIPVSKNRVSLSYVLISLAISVIVYLLFEASSKMFANRAGVLCWWGQNALTLYLTHLLLLALFGLPDVAWWYSDAAPWLVALQLTAILTVMTLVARKLNRRTA